MFALTPFQNRYTMPASRHRGFREFDNFFDRFFMTPAFESFQQVGNFDLYEKDDTLFLSVEAPGANPEDIEIVTTKNRVAIRSKKETEEGDGNQDDGKTWYSRKSVTMFNYEVTLPGEIDVERAEATFENGIIRISAPKLQVSGSKVLPLKKA